MAPFSLILLALALGQSGGSELVDLIPASEYWQIKGVEAGTDDLVKLATTAPAEDDPAGEVQRLMAVRSLGEFGVVDAQGPLEKLTGDDDPAVARQAAIALARVRDKPVDLPAADHADALAGDVASLPGGVNVVGQFRVMPMTGKPSSIDDLIAEFGPAMQGMGPGGGQDVATMRRQLAAALIGVADQIGNIRVDAVTVGVVGNPDRDGVAVVVGRGRYHRDRLVRFLTPQADEVKEVAGRPVLRFRDAVLVFDSDERLVLLGGEDDEALPVERVVAGLDGKREQPGEGVAALLKAVDRSGPLWGVVQMTEDYRGAADPPLSQMKHLTVSSRSGLGEAGEPRLTVTVRGEADDAEAMTAAAAKVKDGVTEGLREMKQARDAGQAPASLVDPMVELLESIEVATDGAAGTATATWEGGAMMPLLVPMMWFGASAPAPAAPAAVAAPARVEVQVGGTVEEAAPVEAAE